ncbi:hypothetical protein [Anatilimnocola floriformis]|uniref:hypothetical protein n=1 Tax=Anatilimnocola floriformis TaxID=2948575 RepID=UPI0020C3A831|nr:hypothetical protein [Anatilimnocola floriformis]
MSPALRIDRLLPPWLLALAVCLATLVAITVLQQQQQPAVETPRKIRQQQQPLRTAPQESIPNLESFVVADPGAATTTYQVMLQQADEEPPMPLERARQEQNSAAVALSWLARHQQADGSWSFAHRGEKCDAGCSHEGKNAEQRNEPTALVLLNFLGAGQSDVTRGPYQANCKTGWAYLLAQKKESKQGDISFADFSQGNTRTQSLCTLLLCEASQRSGDESTKQLAQAALNQLLREPLELDDGWRWLALHSARLNGLKTNESLTISANQFLAGSLQLRPSGESAVQRQRKLVSTGLLAQMTAGWREKDIFVERATKSIIDDGVVGNDVDQLFFSTLALRSQPTAWEDWSRQRRKHLVASQSREGHSAGSWYFADDSSAKSGGRLYCTAMVLASQEIYYRYLTVYKPIPALDAQQEF